MKKITQKEIEIINQTLWNLNAPVQTVVKIKNMLEGLPSAEIEKVEESPKETNP